MTWDELTDLLIKLGKEHDSEPRVVRHEDRSDVVALYFVPVAWFISMKFSGALSIGVYEGEQN